MNLFPLTCGGLLLDDSYNSNPLSAAAALNALKSLAGQGRRIAVLGDMLELGERSEQFHHELGRKAAAVADRLVAVGQFAQAVCAGAAEAGMSAEKISAVEDVAAATALLQEEQRSADRILVKGSRGVKLDQLVVMLKTAEVEEKGV